MAERPGAVEEVISFRAWAVKEHPGFAQQNSDRPKVLTPHLLPSPISSTDFVLLGKAEHPAKSGGRQPGGVSSAGRQEPRGCGCRSL